ncbi:ParB/RepB/Spo0J family partition protein [Massilia oculi]|uniref:ParB/RepB/Spo0J family partition protein n=1 Tax=Massilia oculi TaxID=945844 RepID=UPI0028ACF250|nr:ParB/RepB/Spo0J family partition protein [Massilia oculi]
MRALTALKQAAKAPPHADGRPPEMPLSKIVRDPENPRPPLHLRTPDEQQQQIELNENVRQRGIKSPISLRPHPSEPDTWVINHGHCRYDAAEAAGFPTIPYFIDPNFDSYDQVAENLHRSDLSIWAIAGFIKRKLDEGQSKTAIAQRLGKEGLNYVTEHLALVDAPHCVHGAYANAVRSPRTLYDLRRAHDEFPEQVDAWCLGGARITRDSIRELLEGLRHDVIGAVSQQESEIALLNSTLETRTRADDQAGDESGSNNVQDALERARLRHDVIVACPQRDEPTLNCGGEEQQSGDPPSTSGGLRHDVILRSPPSPAASTPAPSRKSSGANPSTTNPAWNGDATSEEIPVRYMGRDATVSPETKVTIAVDGERTEVRLADLEFSKSR